jgi:hypothetical protein
LLHCNLSVWEDAKVSNIRDKVKIQPQHGGVGEEIGDEKAVPVHEVHAKAVFVEHGEPHIF